MIVTYVDTEVAWDFRNVLHVWGRRLGQYLGSWCAMYHDQKMAFCHEFRRQQLHGWAEDDVFRMTRPRGAAAPAMGLPMCTTGNPVASVTSPNGTRVYVPVPPGSTTAQVAMLLAAAFGHDMAPFLLRNCNGVVVPLASAALGGHFTVEKGQGTA